MSMERVPHTIEVRVQIWRLAYRQPTLGHLIRPLVYPEGVLINVPPSPSSQTFPEIIPHIEECVRLMERVYMVPLDMGRGPQQAVRNSCF